MQPKLDCSELSHLALVASVFIKSLFITVDISAGCLATSFHRFARNHFGYGAGCLLGDRCVG